MAEDEFRHPDLLCRVLLNRDAVAIILHRDDVLALGIRARRDLDVLHRCATGLRTRAYEGITRIHHDLVKDLVEARIEGHLAAHHLARRIVPDPALLSVRLRAADVGVGQLEDVLTVRMLLVGGCSSHLGGSTREGVMTGGQIYPARLLIRFVNRISLFR